MEGRDSFYVTTPIYYVNDKPHIGHAYTTIACDVIARFMRLDGRRVKFLTGTDEHGQKVEKSAAAAGVAPLEFCDDVSARFRELSKLLDCSNDDFIRTTEERHKRAAQAIWSRLVDNGNIYLGRYAGWYAVRDEAFFAEDELTEVDGKKLAPSGAEVEWVEEASYFFRLSNWGEPLLEYYRRHEDFVLPESRFNEVKRFVEGGLKDLSVSRTTFKWGIPIPNDPDHIMYVWLDALTNYISALGFPDTDNADYRTFWPADVHVVGKDILRFHAVYWPAFLMAAGLEPPRRVYAHGWWTNEGQKISKSLGNVIDPLQLIDKYGVDSVRYFVMREVPFGSDGNFSHEAMVKRINADLANDLGNLAQRTLSMIFKNCGAQIPAHGEPSPDDAALLDAAAGLLDACREVMSRQAIDQMLGKLWEVVSAANRYIDAQAPWKLKKTDPPRMGEVLYTVAETLRRLAILAQPVMPGSAGKLLDQLAVPHDRRTFAHLSREFALVPETAIAAPAGVFPRWTDESAE